MLTARKKLFAETYLLTSCASESAKIAGYSTKTCASQGSRLLKDVDIIALIQADRERITKRLDERKDALALTKETFVERVAKDYETVDVDSPNRPRFADLVGRATGLLGNHQPTTVNNTQINIKTDINTMLPSDKWGALRSLLEQ